MALRHAAHTARTHEVGLGLVTRGLCRMAHKKYGLSLAGTILVYVLKARFSSKYLDVLRSPHKLKFAGTPIK